MIELELVYNRFQMWFEVVIGFVLVVNEEAIVLLHDACNTFRAVLWFLILTSVLE